MNIIQTQNNLKDMSDQVLQKELLQPSGAAPGFLVLSELNRRKQMRSAYDAQKQQPQKSMAEEFSQGLGSADVGSYPDAVRQTMSSAPPPTQVPESPNPMQGAPMGQSSPMGDQPQAFADGGAVEMASKATMANPEKEDGPAYWTDFLTGNRKDALGLGMMAGPLMAPITNIANGESVGNILKSMSPIATGLNAFGVKFADGGEVDGGYSAMMTPSERLRRLAQMRLKSGPMTEGTYGIEAAVQPPLTFREKYNQAMNVPSKDLAGIAAATIQNMKIDGSQYAGYGSSGPGADEMEVAQRDMKNPLWRVSRGKTEVAKFGGQDYAPDPSGFPPAEFTAGPLSNSPPSSGPNMGLEQPPLPNFGGPDAQGIAGLLDPVSGGAAPNGAGGQRPSSGGGGGPGAGSGGGSGAGGGRGVGGALNIGGEGLAQYVNEIRALGMPDRFGEMEQRNTEDRDKLLAGVEGQKGMALLTAGLGIMGGESPFAAVNIGRGAQAGVKYWNDAEKEMRQAQRDIRTAENQITIARANRDEKQLESGMKLYATAQEKIQQGLNRANSSGIAAADRAQRAELARLQYESEDKNRNENRELNKLKFESEAKTREETREQSRINEAGTLATRYEQQANAIDMKIATLSQNPLSTPESAGELAALKSQSQALRDQANQSANMHRSMVIDREVRSGRLAQPKDESDYTNMKSGTRYVAPDGTIRVKP